MLCFVFGVGIASAQDTASSEGNAEEESAESATSNDETSRLSIPRARALFDAGSVAVEEGDYESAFRYFVESYELSAEPRMLFNLGSCSERMQRSADALGFYRRYLVEVPEASNRQFVEGRIRALETVIANTEAEAAAQAEARAEAEAEQRGPEVERNAEATGPNRREAEGTPTAAWAIIGVGGAAVIAGAVLLATGGAKRRDLDKAPEGASFADFEGHVSSANLQTGLGIGLLAAGLASATVGLVIVVSSGADEDDTQVVLGLDRVSVRGSF